MTLRIGVLAMAAAAYLFMGTGCANNKVAAERDTLAAQNKDLMAQLQTERDARQMADTRAAAGLNPLPGDPTTPGMGGPLVFNNGRPSGTPRPGPSATPPTPHQTTPVNLATPKAATAIGGNVLFASGRVTLDATATKALDSIAATIKTKYKGDKLVIEGFADNTPLSKTSVWTSNADLAKARATAVKNYLAKKGIAAADMTVKGTTTSSTGATSRKVEVEVAK